MRAPRSAEPWARASGFTVDETGRWARTVHIYDLARYYEHHADLRFDEWRASATR